jgi:hypothetical protein
MTAAGPVLRDIHLPPAAWWPPAPGWWLLAVLVLVTGALVAAWFVYRRRHGTLRALLREIDALELAYPRDADSARLADQASRLLRRVARRVEPRAASANGSAWRAFVHKYAHADATRQALDALLDVRFRVTPGLDASALCAALRAWCRAALRRRPARSPQAPVTACGGAAT